MPDYQKMYTELFNEISSTIERLQKIQQDAEELYISAQEPVWLADYAKPEDYPKEKVRS